MGLHFIIREKRPIHSPKMDFWRPSSPIGKHKTPLFDRLCPTLFTCARATKMNTQKCTLISVLLAFSFSVTISVYRRLEKKAMTTLRQLLEDTAYPLLCVIARQRALTVPHNCSKAALIELAHDTLSEPESLQDALLALSPAEWAVLEDLRLADGRLPRYHVARRHGDFRRYRPWRDDAPLRPWENPRSPTERLYFLGLIFWDKETRDLVIPQDLLLHYPSPAAPTQTTKPEPPRPPVAMAAHHDLAQLLALLDAASTRLIHGRWLPPNFLATWGERCLIPPAHPGASSELRTERRRCLHYLAEAAGLVANADDSPLPLLKPTPDAWAWLTAPPPARFGALWEALNGASDERWKIYRMPGHDLLHHPAALVEAALESLRRDAAHFGPSQADLALGAPEQVAARLLDRDPELRNDLRGKFLEPDALLSEAVVALLTGALAWLGAVNVGEKGDLSLTAWGAHWLHPRAPAPEAVPEALFTLEPDLVFAPPDGFPSLLALATLTACGERLDDGRFQVTRERFVAALQRGHALSTLLGRLDAAASRPLSGTERARLTGWAEASQRMVIRRVTVLEVADPDILTRLSEKRRGRRRIVRTLSRRAVVVDEGGLAPLVRRLTKQEGAPPHVDLPPETPPANPALGRGGAAHLWLAAQVYRALGDLIDLPTRLPHDLVQHLAALAETESGPLTLGAAQAACHRTIEALQDAIQGRAAFPAWVETTLPVAESVALIERALAEGYALEMDYYTAGRDVLTHRVVEPHRLEYRGDVAYLLGFCQRAQAERVFRVDRIQALTLKPLPEAPDTGWDV